jgi:hypothetical protein
VEVDGEMGMRKRNRKRKVGSAEETRSWASKEKGKRLLVQALASDSESLTLPDGWLAVPKVGEHLVSHLRDRNPIILHVLLVSVPESR